MKPPMLLLIPPTKPPALVRKPPKAPIPLHRGRGPPRQAGRPRSELRTLTAAARPNASPARPVPRLSAIADRRDQGPHCDGSRSQGATIACRLAPERRPEARDVKSLSFRSWAADDKSRGRRLLSAHSTRDIPDARLRRAVPPPLRPLGMRGVDRNAGD